ncbi:MAG: hypothetical protein ABI456_16785, partial [Ktedonobacteraceae bacterium]
GSRQMMHHQSREHHIECLIGEGELLNHPGLELNRQMAPSRFRTGTGDLLGTRVNACDGARTAHVACHFQCQRSRAAAHIQHLLSGLQVGQVGGPLPQHPPLAMEHESVNEPSPQVVAPAIVPDQSFCLFGRRLVQLAVVVMCE